MFEKYRYKSDYLRRVKLTGVSNDLSKGLFDWLSLHYSNIAPSVRYIMSHDVSYFCFRHYKWRDSYLYLIILNDYLCDQYSLQRDESSTISKVALDLIGIDSNRYSADLTKRDIGFLKSIFVSLASSISIEHAVNDLSVGESFLERIKRVSSGTNTGIDVYDNHFGEEVDRALKEVIFSFYKEKKSKPWILQFYQFCEIFESSKYSSSMLENMFDILLIIGSENKGTFELDIGMSGKRSIDRKDLNKYLTLLKESDLIYCENFKVKKWFATSQGVYLTSIRFAIGYLKEKEAPLSDLSGYPSHYQLAVIDQLPHHRLVELLEAFKHEKCIFSSEAWNRGVKLLAENTDHNDILDAVMNRLKRSSTNHSKILESLRFLREASKLESSLRSLFRDSESILVRQELLNTASMMKISIVDG